MRKLVVTENITLDGVIDLAGGWFDPLDEDVDQSDITAAGTEQREAADALLVGRRTFESFREFWPRQTNDPTGVSGYLNAVKKYVVSSTLEDPEWENSVVLRGPLVDEYRLFVYPVLVGDGARLFESATERLELLETRRFVSGAVLLRYAICITENDAP